MVYGTPGGKLELVTGGVTWPAKVDGVSKAGRGCVGGVLLLTSGGEASVEAIGVRYRPADTVD